MQAPFRPIRFAPPSTLVRNLALIALVAGGITAAGLVVEPQQTWPSLLLAGYYMLGLSLGAVLFIALQYVSNAGWSVALRRVPEAMASALLPFGGVLLVLFFGIHSLYEWSHREVVAADPILQIKSGWLNEPFFIVRSLLYYGVWLLLARKIVNASRRQDENGALEMLGRGKRYSAIFIVVFAFTFTLASMDWVMSLEPHWYSTIFGIYNFSGLFLSALAAMTLVVILLRRMGPLQRVVSVDHLHNLGKFIFAFSTFWMYIWFSQYLLLWYANIPEGSTYLVRREQGSWVIFTIVNVIFNWAIPFVLLLPRWTKQNEGLLLKVCVILLVGRWIDVFWMIMPPSMPAAPVLSLWVVAPIVGSLALFFFVTFRTLAAWNLVPLRDPFLVESVHSHS